MTPTTRKIAFVSPHCLVDYTNGAATATRDGLKVLAEQGFECMAFCGTRLDDPTEGLIQESLFRRKVKYEVRRVRYADGESGRWGDGGKERGGYEGRLIFLVEGGGAGCQPAMKAIDRETASWQTAPRLNSPHPNPLPVGEGTKEDPFPAGEGTITTGSHPNPLPAGEGTIAVTLFENASTRGGWFGRDEVNAFLTACDLFLRKNRPDVVVTYGGDAVSIAVQRLAKRLDVPIVFWLHNFAYTDRSAFEAVDYVIVPSEFSRRYYREKLGLECHVLPNIVNWEAAEVRGQGSEVGGQSYVTFINPHAVKGVYVFARIARELARRRPDIPILVTQGRSKTDALLNPELGLAPHIAGELCIPATTQRSEKIAAPRQTESGNEFPHSKFRTADGTRSVPATLGRNIYIMPFTPDPRSFYPAVFSVTKLLLMPSLWFESFGLVAAEAMLNGIPVLASNRGALTETVGGSPRPEVNAQMGRWGDGEMGSRAGRPEQACAVPAGGYLFDIPARYTSETREVPTAEEVEPWVETIIRLWDDEAEYARRSQAAREHAQQWRPERLKPLYQEFFNGVTRRSGPPFVATDVR
jgi:glycosyltransferase involved in cell wall biosynthesis